MNGQVLQFLLTLIQLFVTIIMSMSSETFFYSIHTSVVIAAHTLKLYPPQSIIVTSIPTNSLTRSIYIIKERLETYSGMESYLPNSDRHAASWIFSDGPTKPTGVVKLRYNALELFFDNVAI